MRAIHASVRVVQVHGALSHGDLLKFIIIIIIIIIAFQCCCFHMLSVGQHSVELEVN